MPRLFLFFSLLIAAGSVAQASPLEGSWLGPVDPDGNRSTIDIYPCGDLFCGKVSAVTQPSAEYLLGQVILLNLQQEREDYYSGGLIRFDHLRWTFSGDIRMQSFDRATLRGCWARIVCQSVEFTRVSSA